jgi:hypothetical protein
MRSLLAATLIATLALASGAQASQLPGTDGGPSRAGAVPGNFVKHEEQYWTWYGPRSWAAGSGPYGIDIGDPQGTASIDYGGSSIFCDGTPDQHFAAQRASLKNGGIALKHLKLRKISRVKQSGNTFFNTLQFSGKSGRTALQGEIEMQYASIDGQYCYQSTLAKTALADGYGDRIKVLRAIWNNTFYYGPGLTP